MSFHLYIESSEMAALVAKILIRARQIYKPYQPLTLVPTNITSLNKTYIHVHTCLFAESPSTIWRESNPSFWLPLRPGGGREIGSELSHCSSHRTLRENYRQNTSKQHKHSLIPRLPDLFHPDIFQSQPKKVGTRPQVRVLKRHVATFLFASTPTAADWSSVNTLILPSSISPSLSPSTTCKGREHLLTTITSGLMSTMMVFSLLLLRAAQREQ